MCYNGFTIKINMYKYKSFKDGRCAHKKNGLRHLKVNKFIGVPLDGLKVEVRLDVI